MRHLLTKLRGHRIKILAVSNCLLIAFSANPIVADICVSERLTVGVVEGVVLSIPNIGNEPIPEATLELSNCRAGECEKVAEVTADMKGRFRFENLKLGRYELKAKAQGFKHYTTTVFVRRRAKAVGDARHILIGLEAGIGCGGWAKLSERKSR